MSKANIIAGAHIKNFSEIIKPTKEEIEDKRKENKIISSEIKNCIFCNTKFNYGRSSRLSCGLCKIKYYCEYCGKEIIVPICKTNSRTQSNIYKLIQENNIKSYKSCCSTSHSRLLYNKNQSKPGVCRKCKEYSKIRNSFGLCPECTGRSKETICIKCGGESNKLDTTGRCPKCASKSGEGKCVKCKQEKNNLNAFGICLECMTGPGKCTTCGNFAINRNATGQCTKCISNLSGKGKCVTCGKYVINRTIMGQCKDCLYCNFKPFFIENNSCKKHKEEKLTYKNECWSCYKEKFKQNLILPEEFKKYNPTWQLTYRQTRYSTKGQMAMEKELVEKNIKWFTYIKFYEINKEIKPLQVCKSGSKLVNISGSDVGFSTNINHGAARRFLKDNNLKWHINKILIFKCKSEKEAYNLEKELTEKFNLFTS